MLSNVKDFDRLSLVISLISEQNDHQKITTKRELLRIFIIIAEIFESNLIEFLPKIVSIMCKRLKEGDINQIVSEALSGVIEHCLKNLDSQEALKPLSFTLKSLLNLFNSNSKKNTQIGCAMTISKIIQTSPVDCLYCLMSEVKL